MPRGVPKNGTTSMKRRNFLRPLGLGLGGAALAIPAIAQGRLRRRAMRAGRQRVRHRQGGGAALRHVIAFRPPSPHSGAQIAVALLRQPAGMGMPGPGLPGGDRHGLRRCGTAGHQPVRGARKGLDDADSSIGGTLPAPRRFIEGFAAKSSAALDCGPEPVPRRIPHVARLADPASTGGGEWDDGAACRTGARGNLRASNEVSPNTSLKARPTIKRPNFQRGISHRHSRR